MSTDVLLDTAIAAGESATRIRSVGLNKRTQRAIHRRTRCKETFVNGRTQRRKGKVTTSPKVEVNERKCKRKHSGRENRKPRTRLDLPMKKLDSARWVFFGLKRQRFEFVCDVQENDDFETPGVDRAAYVSVVQKCKSVMMDSTELPSS